MCLRIGGRRGDADRCSGGAAKAFPGTCSRGSGPSLPETRRRCSAHCAMDCATLDTFDGRTLRFEFRPVAFEEHTRTTACAASRPSERAFADRLFPRRRRSGQSGKSASAPTDRIETRPCRSFTRRRSLRRRHGRARWCYLLDCDELKAAKPVKAVSATPGLTAFATFSRQRAGPRERAHRAEPARPPPCRSGTMDREGIRPRRMLRRLRLHPSCPCARS